MPPVHAPLPSLITSDAHPLLATRGRRVVMLLIGICLLSVADLVVTMTHLRTVGMAEANPIAAWLIQTTRSPWALILFKSSTAGMGVALLFALRGHRIAEVAAWCGLALMGGMAFTWNTYTRQLDESDLRVLAHVAPADTWLRLDDPWR